MSTYRYRVIPSPEHDGLWAVEDRLTGDLTIDHVTETEAVGEAELLNEGSEA